MEYETVADIASDFMILTIHYKHSNGYGILAMVLYLQTGTFHNFSVLIIILYLEMDRDGTLPLLALFIYFLVR